MNGINTNMEMERIASNPKNWKRTHKKSYEVYVCCPLAGVECSNIFEGSRYITDNKKKFIISGTAGENWVIDEHKLASTYTFADGTPITLHTLATKCNKDGQMEWQKLRTITDNNTNWALLVPKQVQNFPVETSWGDMLLANRPGIRHGYGDFLVCADNDGRPNPYDVWVVNGEIFPRTYDLHSFPKMFPPSVTSAQTQVPQKSFLVNTGNLTEEIKKSAEKLEKILKKYSVNIGLIDVGLTQLGSLCYQIYGMGFSSSKGIIIEFDKSTIGKGYVQVSSSKQIGVTVDVSSPDSVKSLIGIIHKELA